MPAIGFAFPIQYMDIPAAQRKRRVRLEADTCVIDDRRFFVRGCLEIPVRRSRTPFVWGVWVSVSRTSFALEQRPDAGTPRHSGNASAYEQYLRGRWHWAKDTPEGLRKAKDHFLKAIALDPGYALAYSGLADTYALLGSYSLMPISDSHPLGRDAALKALSLNESLGEAHNSLAAILGDYYWEWTEAERHFKRAIDLEPNYVTALHFYSFYLAYTGRSAEALPIAQRAISLDPLSLRAQVNLGVVWNMARRYDEAVTQFERTLDLDSGDAMTHAMLGLTYAYKGMPERAVAELALARKAGGDRPDLIALHGYALARAGHTGQALAAIDELHRVVKPRDSVRLPDGRRPRGLGRQESRFRMASEGGRRSSVGTADAQGGSILRPAPL